MILFQFVPMKISKRMLNSVLEELQLQKISIRHKLQRRKSLLTSSVPCRHKFNVAYAPLSLTYIPELTPRHQSSQGKNHIAGAGNQRYIHSASAVPVRHSSCSYCGTCNSHKAVTVTRRYGVALRVQYTRNGLQREHCVALRDGCIMNALVSIARCTPTMVREISDCEGRQSEL
jgi:hypothetical protein